MILVGRNVTKVDYPNALQVRSFGLPNISPFMVLLSDRIVTQWDVNQLAIIDLKAMQIQALIHFNQRIQILGATRENSWLVSETAQGMKPIHLCHLEGIDLNPLDLTHKGTFGFPKRVFKPLTGT